MPDDFTQQAPTPPGEGSGLMVKAIYAINLTLFELMEAGEKLLEECERKDRERPRLFRPGADSYYGDLPWIWLTYLVSRYPISPLFGENGGLADDDPSVQTGYR